MRKGFPHTRHWADGADTGQCSVHRPSETGLEGTGPRVWLSGVMGGPSGVSVLQPCSEYS